jgi:sec-independent protein translocase protein TatA
MFAGLASPSHLIIVLAIVLLLFGAKRIPELAKGLGTGIKELREGISTGDAAEAEAPESEKARSEDARPRSGDETVGAPTGQRSI